MSIYTSSRVLPYVYKLMHKTTGQFYYGYREANVVPSTEDLGTHYFSSSQTIKDLGFNNFEIEIIAEFINPNKNIAASDAWTFEQRQIEAAFKSSLCLNKHFVKSDKMQWKRTGSHSEQAISKMKKSHLGKIMPDEVKRRISLALVGRETTQETRDLLSIAGKGRLHTAEARNKISISLTGRTFNEEWTAKLSKNNIGKNAFLWQLLFEDQHKESITIDGLHQWCEAQNINVQKLRYNSATNRFYDGMKCIKLTRSWSPPQ